MIKSPSILINDLKQSLKLILEEESTLIEKFAIKKSVRKCEMILNAGDNASVFYYIKQGISRSYILENSLEITTQFSFNSDIVFPLNAFPFNSQSEEYIQAMTDLDYFEINLYEFERLISKNPLLSNIERKIYQLQNYQLGMRVRSFQTKTAKQRYLEIIAREPRIIKYCQLSHLATYLGISSGSLSRIRKEIKNNII
ncbi:MAG: Crp/Fnr family transcriptional regulator [Bacteroidota bacterium]